MHNQRWRPWKRKKQRQNQKKKEMSDEKKRESSNSKEEKDAEHIRGVFFVPHTGNSDMAKRIERS